MKALTRDQERTLNDRLGEWDVDTRTEVYDGDTRRDRKRDIRSNADTILTNPAGLNVYLPRHNTDSGWARFYNNLELIVVDEAHQYSGIMGTHVAWILRRLRRLLKYYDADPQFVLTTATIGNPAEHATRLTSEEFSVIDEDGSPHGERDIVLWKPPIDEEALREAEEYNMDPSEGGLEEFRISTGRKPQRSRPILLSTSGRRSSSVRPGRGQRLPPKNWWCRSGSSSGLLRRYKGLPWRAREAHPKRD